METLLILALPLLLALAAAGAVLFIKITRRSQRPAGDAVSAAVPVTPMSREHATRLQRRYVAVVAIVVGALAVTALILIFAQ